MGRSIYRVERAGHPEAGSFALKLALHPEDRRFPREVELLQRVVHPSVPCFEDRGWWTGPDGRNFPYVVMEWVDGVPLYEWAREQKPTSRQVLEVLAQLASALAATHGVGGVHRDVKGDNIMVTASGRAVLYRLCTGSYPRVATEDSERSRPLRPRELATMSEGLEEQMLAALSEDRLARPQASSLANALKVAATAADATIPIAPTPSAARTEVTSSPWPRRRRRMPVWLSRVGTAVAGGLLVSAFNAFLHRGQMAPEKSLSAPIVEHTYKTPTPDSPDAGVGEGVLASTEVLPRVGPFMLSLGRPMPNQPYPGQRRPPCERGERAINGGCWVGPIDMEKPPCGEKMFDYEGRCYFVSFESPRQTTSDQR